MKDKSVFYEKIDSSFKKEKIDVYKSAKIWFAEEFRNSNYVLKMDDKDLGELIGKGTAKISVPYGTSDRIYWLQFTVKVSCRKDKVRVQVYDIGVRTDEETEYTALEYYLTKSDDFTQTLLRTIDSQIEQIMTSGRIAIAAKSDNF
jgi:hypothetical protein